MKKVENADLRLVFLLNGASLTIFEPRCFFTLYSAVLTFSSGSEGGTGVSGLSGSADLSFFLSPFLSFPFPVPGSPDFGRRGTNGMLENKELYKIGKRSTPTQFNRRLKIDKEKFIPLKEPSLFLYGLVFFYPSKLLFSGFL